MKINNIILVVLTLLLANCAEIIKNSNQESKYMIVSGGGYYLRGGKYTNEESYGMVVAFKDIPQKAKYLIADFEVPNNRGIYERKVIPLKKNQSTISLRSNPIYGVEYGFYYIKAYLSEDKDGDKIIDSIEQTIKIVTSVSKGRDYATQYSLYDGEKEIKKLIVIYPNKRSKKLLSAEIPSKFKIGHVAILSDELGIEYVPLKETVHNWSKIITLRENKPLNNEMDHPHIYASVTGNALYNKFSKFDKDFKVSYIGVYNGKIINSDDPSFVNLVRFSNEVSFFMDYADFSRAKKYPYEREYLVAKFVKSDVSIWEIQSTVRYDKRWSKDKIDSLKKEAISTIGNLHYADDNPINNLKKIALENGIKDFQIKEQRLDDRELNIKYYEGR